MNGGVPEFLVKVGPVGSDLHDRHCKLLRSAVLRTFKPQLDAFFHARRKYIAERRWKKLCILYTLFIGTIMRWEQYHAYCWLSSMDQLTIRGGNNLYLKKKHYKTYHRLCETYDPTSSLYVFARYGEQVSLPKTMGLFTFDDIYGIFNRTCIFHLKEDAYRKHI